MISIEKLKGIPMSPVFKYHSKGVNGMNKLSYKIIIIFSLLLLFVINGIGYADDAWQQYEKKGEEYFGKNMYDDAIIEFNKSIEITPNYWAYVFRGQAYRYKQQYEQAISDYSKAIEINQKNENIYSLRGDAYSHTGLYGHAITDLNKAIEMNPDNGFSYFVRARTYKAMNKHNEAWEDLIKAEKLGESIPPLIMENYKKEASVITQSENESGYKKTQKTDVALEGVFVDESGKNLAIIKGIIYREGDSIGDIKIEKIDKDSVNIIVNGQKKNIKIGQSFSSASK